MAANVTDAIDEPTTNPDEWTEFRAVLLADPENRAEYERTFREVVAIRKILQTCEARREKAGFTKAELARRVGMNPASIRRLFTAEESNPTLKTMLGIFDVLGLEISLKPAQRSKRRTRPLATRPFARDRANVG